MIVLLKMRKVLKNLFYILKGDWRSYCIRESEYNNENVKVLIKKWFILIYLMVYNLRYFYFV